MERYSSCPKNAPPITRTCNNNIFIGALIIRMGVVIGHPQTHFINFFYPQKLEIDLRNQLNMTWDCALSYSIQFALGTLY